MRFDYVPHDIYIKLGLIVNTFGEGGGVYDASNFTILFV